MDNIKYTLLNINMKVHDVHLNLGLFQTIDPAQLIGQISASDLEIKN